MEIDEGHLSAGGALIGGVSAQGEVDLHGLVELSELKFYVRQVKECLLREGAVGGGDCLFEGVFGFSEFFHGGVDQAELLEHHISGAEAAEEALFAVIFEE